MANGDRDLALAAASGDRAAFAALLARHYDRLFGLCFRLTGRRETAEDLTQDICLALPAKLKHFRGEAQLTTWLYRVAVNAAHDRRRRAATRAKSAEGWGRWESDRRAAVEDSAANLRWLRHAMTALPEPLRDTAALVLGEELTHAEAALVTRRLRRHRQLAPFGNPQAPPRHATGGIEFMTDPLDELKHAMDRATPMPDPARRARQPGTRAGALRACPRIGGGAASYP